MQVEAVLYMTAPLSRSPRLVSWTAIRRQDRVQTGGSYRGCGGQKESVWRARRRGSWLSLAGLHAQLLSVGQLVRLRF